MIEVQVYDSPDKQWNARLINSGLATIYQSKEIALSFERVGQTPQFLTFVNDNGAIVGQLLVYSISRFKNTRGVKQLFGKIPIIQKNIIQWTYGPIIIDQNYASDVYSALGNFLISRKNRVSGWQHPLLTNGVESLKGKFILKPWSTFLIDLKRPKDEIYNNIEKHNGRKNIERSIKRGVEVEEINENSLSEYVQLRNQMSEKSDSITLEDMINWYQILKPLGYSGYLARKDGIPVGGLLFSYLGGLIIEGGVARSEKDRTENLYSQDLIKWKIIEWGIDNNLNFYNLAGFNPSPATKKEDGIFLYKKKWGGKRYDYWIIRR